MSRPKKIHKPLGVSFDDALSRIADAPPTTKATTMKIKLTYGELKELLRQDPESAGGGGFQSYLVQLGYRVDDNSGELDLDNDDLKRIGKYVTEYGRGGYQNRILKIFGRTLGAALGWPEDKYKKYLK